MKIRIENGWIETESLINIATTDSFMCYYKTPKGNYISRTFGNYYSLLNDQKTIDMLEEREKIFNDKYLEY